MIRTGKWFTQKISTIINPFVSRCSKTGRMTGIRNDLKISRFFFPIMGLMAIVWFLIRVVPKPDRAAYPCQRAALGIGGGFLAYVLIFFSSFSLAQKIRRHFAVSIIIALIAVCGLFGGIAAVITDTLHAETTVVILAPPEGVNQPIGQARGIHPGRVVWIQDFDATSWDGEKGLWWDEENTDQQIVETMFSKALLSLTGENADSAAWDALFRYHNKANKRGEQGYQKDETIVIKLNCNTDGTPGERGKKKGHASTQVVYTLVKQLIEEAGVPGANIILTDPSRHIGNPIYDKIRSNPKPDYQRIVFAGKEDRDVPHYIYAEPDMDCPIYFDMPDGTRQTFYFPKIFSQATYMINAGQFRPHSIFGLTMVGKNHFGSIYDGKSYMPSPLHAFAVKDGLPPNRHGLPHCHPSLLGHDVTNGKTFLYILDGLYTSYTQTKDIVRWSTMENDWFSSLLMSQDPIALDSVGYDFVKSEPNLIEGNTCFNGHVDSFLHEAALAGHPPSGAVYDPEKDGSKLTSLGVHEHWNNPVDKQYSRNLGVGDGIELIAAPGTNRERK